MSQSPAAPGGAPLPALDSIMGAWLIGTFIGLLLQGVGYHQTYQYFRLYPRDPRWIKSTVFAITVVETLNTIMTIHACYYNLVTNYANPAALLASPVWSMTFLPVPGSITAVITQLFFARRVYKIDRQFLPVTTIAALLVLAFSGCYIAMAGLGANAADIDQYLKHSWLASLGSGLITIADLLLTASLIYLLRSNRTGFIRTDSMLDFIIAYTVTSGLVICVFNILNVAFCIAWPKILVDSATSIVLTKLYSNTFLASLNARQAILACGAQAATDQSVQFNSTILKQTPRSDVSSGTRRSELAFGMQQRVHVSHLGSDATAIELKVVPQGFDAADPVENDRKGALARSSADSV